MFWFELLNCDCRGGRKRIKSENEVCRFEVVGKFWNDVERIFCGDSVGNIVCCCCALWWAFCILIKEKSELFKTRII